jgi:ribosome-associated protein
MSRTPASRPGRARGTSMLKIDDRLSIPLEEFQWDFARSGGPGGQNVNKVNSKVLLRWNPGTSPSLPAPIRARLLALVENRLTTAGELLVTSQASRDQGRNVEDCLAKVRALVLAAVRPPKVRKPTRPTRGSELRRTESKLRRAETKRGRRAPDQE